MKVKMMNDNVLVRRKEAETVSAGGIIIPDDAQKRGVEGIVVAAGPGKLTENGNRLPMGVKEGDVVILPEWTNEIKIEGESLVVVHESNILAVYDQESTPTQRSSALT